MLRMPNERKMSVENEGDVADHCGLRIADCGMRIAERNTNEASYPQPAITNRQLSERAAKVLEAVQTFFNYVQASGVTQPDRAVVTKRSSRNNGDVRFTQQTVGEIL